MKTTTFDYVHMLTLPSVYNKSVNCYLLELPTYYVLVDTGENNADTKHFWQTLLPTLQKPIRYIVLTHIHTDHAGCCAFLQKQLQCTVLASVESKKKLSVMQQSPKNTALLRAAQAYGYTYPYTKKMLLDEEEAYSFTIDETFKQDDVLTFDHVDLRAMHLPGHAVDQYCFYDKNNALFIASDHLIDAFNPILIIEEGHENPLALYFDSLEKVRALPSLRIAFSGHGKPIDDVTARITTIEQRHHEKLQQLDALLKEAPRTLLALFEAFYKRPFEKPNAQLMQLLVYVRYLETQHVLTIEHDLLVSSRNKKR